MDSIAELASVTGDTPVTVSTTARPRVRKRRIDVAGLLSPLATSRGLVVDPIPPLPIPPLLVDPEGATVLKIWIRRTGALAGTVLFFDRRDSRAIRSHAIG